MIIYSRHISKKLLTLRLAFFILATTWWLSFNYQYNNLGYFVAVIFLTVAVIAVKDFVVANDSFSISKYYCFGLIKINWHFNKTDNIRVSSFGSDFGETASFDNEDFTSTEQGCLFSLVSIFLPKNITMKEFKIEKFDEYGNRTKTVYILLDYYEFNFLQAFV